MAFPRRLLPALAGTLLAFAPAAPRAADPPGPPVAGAERMVAHRAAYRLSLAQTRQNSGITNARGAMLYEVGDACEGWTTRQRFSLSLTARDGQEVETTSDYSTYETKDGRSIRFSLTQTSQGAVSQRIAGEARLGANGAGFVRYTQPEAKEERLPSGTLLPTIHTIQALAQARAGQRLMNAPLFDGTSPDGAQDSTTAISAWAAPQTIERFPALSPLGSARMRVAFFNRGNARDGAAGAPDYEVGLRYFENGVADELQMDFGEFVVNGQMVELALLPSAC
jgi:hypothetical protein